MGRGGYYLVTEGGPRPSRRSPVAGRRPSSASGLAGEGEASEPITFDDLAFLLEARADISHVRVRSPGGQRTVEKARFLGGAFS